MELEEVEVIHIMLSCSLLCACRLQISEGYMRYVRIESISFSYAYSFSYLASIQHTHKIDVESNF